MVGGIGLEESSQLDDLVKDQQFGFQDLPLVSNFNVQMKHKRIIVEYLWDLQTLLIFYVLGRVFIYECVDDFSKYHYIVKGNDFFL